MTWGYRWFFVVKPAWWKKHVVEAHMTSGNVYPMMKLWSWDKANNLADRLNDMMREERNRG